MTGNKNKKKAQPKRQPQGQARTSLPTQRKGQSVLQPPTQNLAFNVGRQSEIALPVRKGLSTLTIHPDNTRWLGEAAPSFQRWGMRDLTLWYEPRVATSTNGQIALTFLSDFADLSPNSLEETVSLSGAQRGAPWSRFSLGKQRNRLFDYCSPKDFAAADATSKGSRSPGRIVVWADMDASFGSSDIVGWVYYSYTPVLEQPILRRLQVGTATTTPAPQEPGPVVVVPPTEGEPAPVPSHDDYPMDYMYHERQNNSRYDWLGFNAELDQNHIVQLTQRTAYTYFADKGYCCLFNLSGEPIRFFMSVIFRDFNWVSDGTMVTWQSDGASLVGGNTNKGLYWTRDHNDGSFRVNVDIAPKGRFWFQTTWTTGWKRSEIYCMELGLEHGPNDIKLDFLVPELTSSSAEYDLSLLAASEDQQPVETVIQPTVSFKSTTNGVSNGSVYLTDITGPTKSLVIGKGVKMESNAGFFNLNPAADYPLAADRQYLALAIRNTSTEDRYISVQALLVGLETNYPGGRPVATGYDLTVFDDNYAVTSGGLPMLMSNFLLKPGGVVAWTLPKKLDAYNSPLSCGTVHMNVTVLPQPFWTQNAWA